MRRLAKICLIGFAGMAGIVGVWTGTEQWREHQSEGRLNDLSKEIVSLIGFDESKDFHSRLDTVRMFVNDNSIHRIDEAFWAAQASASFPDLVLAYAKGVSAEPAHMECSTRSNLMRHILSALGYRTRTVVIFDTDTNLFSHTFIDVMNPDTKRWETQDADYDIYWRRGGERISVADYAEEIESIEPCGRDTCGWDQRSREGLKAERLRDYLDIVSVTDKQSGTRHALYTSRAHVARIYTKGDKRGSFCEVETKRCADGFDKAMGELLKEHRSSEHFLVRPGLVAQGSWHYVEGGQACSSRCPAASKCRLNCRASRMPSERDLRMREFFEALAVLKVGGSSRSVFMPSALHVTIQPVQEKPA